MKNNVLGLIIISFILSGCSAAMTIGSVGGAAFRVVGDERTFKGQMSDLDLLTRVKNDLVKDDAANVTKIKVYCFNSVVFLIGELDYDAGVRAEMIVSSIEGVKEVKTKWFEPGTTMTIGDYSLHSRIATALLFTKDISSNNLKIDVYGQNVVLTGILSSQEEIDRVIKTVNLVNNVKSVTNFLTYLNNQSTNESAHYKETQELKINDDYQEDYLE